MNTSFVRGDRFGRRMSWRTGRGEQLVRVTVALTLLLLPAGCGNRGNAVSGTIEVDEAHVGPRFSGRVEKIFAWEGDHLHEGQLIVQLDASELRHVAISRGRKLTQQFTTPMRKTAQLEYLQDDAKRQQDLLQRKVVSPNDALAADSAAKSQAEKCRGGAKCELHRRARNWPISMRS